MVYTFQLTNDEIIDMLDLKYIPSKRTGYSLKRRICKINDINKTLEYISLVDAKKVLLSMTLD